MIEILTNRSLYVQRNSIKKRYYEEKREYFKNYRIDYNWSIDGLQ